MKVVLVVAALVLAGCGSEQAAPPAEVVVPASAECTPAGAGQASCAWTADGCQFRALVDSASREVITSEAWC